MFQFLSYFFITNISGPNHFQQSQLLQCDFLACSPEKQKEVESYLLDASDSLYIPVGYN